MATTQEILNEISKNSIQANTPMDKPQQDDKFLAIGNDNTGKYIKYSNLIEDLALYKTEDKTWATVMALIEQGKFGDVYPVGSIFYTPFHYNGQTYQFPWQVADTSRAVIYPDGSSHNRPILQAMYLAPQSVQFSQYRAFLKCPQGLPAGTYNISFAQAWDKLTAEHLNWNFTLTKAVPSGGRVAGFRNFADAQTSDNRKIRVYDAEGRTILETVTASEGATEGGTNLGTIGYTARNGNLNCMQEAFYGFGAYYYSAVKQWLNSTELKNNWWHAMDDWDCAPDELSTLDGFLSCFDSDFVSILKTVQVKTAKNTAQGNASDSYDIDYLRCYIPSTEEMFIESQATGIEGAYLPLNKQFVGKNTPNGWWPENANNGLIKYDFLSKNAQWYRLRSCRRDGAYYTWFVDNSGYVSSINAKNVSKALPLVVI